MKSLHCHCALNYKKTSFLPNSRTLVNYGTSYPHPNSYRRQYGSSTKLLFLNWFKKEQKKPTREEDGDGFFEDFYEPAIEGPTHERPRNRRRYQFRDTSRTIPEFPYERIPGQPAQNKEKAQAYRNFNIPDVPFNSDHPYYYFPAHISVIQDDIDSLYQVLKVYPEKVNDQTTTGTTPLHVACARGNPRMVEILLMHGANADLADNHQHRPIHIACSLESNRCLKILLQHGCEWDYTDFVGRTPLHVAMDYEGAKCAEFLISAKNITSSEYLNVGDRMKFTPLHLAVCRNYTQGVNVMLRQKGTDPNAQDIMGRTALHMAAFKGFSELVDNLLRVGANPNTADIQGNTPMHYVWMGSKENDCYELMEKASGNQDVKNAQGMTPYDLKLQNQNTSELHCKQHGRVPAAFACKHLSTKTRHLGFHLIPSNNPAFTLALCDDCNELSKNEGELTVRLVKVVKPRKMCGICWEEVKLRNYRSFSSNVGYIGKFVASAFFGRSKKKSKAESQESK